MRRILERLRNTEGRPLKLAELQEALGCSRPFLHKLISAGALQAHRVGQQYRVEVSEARRLATDLGIRLMD